MHWKIGNGVMSIEEGRTHVYSFDLEGRLLNYIVDSCSYRRTLQNRVIFSSVVSSTRVSSVLNIEEAKNVVNQAYSEARELLEQIHDPEIVSFKERVLRMSWKVLEDDARRLISLYSNSVPIVPPDQYFSVYVILERGCRWNRCNFCELYHDRTYRTVNEIELEAQVEGLKKYFGMGIEARRSIFLGEANALGVPYPDLLRAIDVLNRNFHLPVYTFSEPFTGHGPKTIPELTEVRVRGLKRVYLGLESGSPNILRMINKPMNLEIFREYVNRLKSAGISVGIIIMTGIGGGEFYDEHVELTSTFIANLPLGNGDIVYMSPFIRYQDFRYREPHPRITDLSPDEILNQGDEIKKRIQKKFNSQIPPPHFPIVPYNLLESQY